MTKAIIDIEAVTGYPLHSWQTETFKNLSGGIQPGEMMIVSAGRQAGKSMFTQQYMQNFMAVFNQPAYKQLTFSKVDDAEWMTVQCNKEIATWVRGQSQKYWYEHNGSVHTIFDLHEKLYTMLKLTFTP